MSRINLNAVIVEIVLLTFAIAVCDAGDNFRQKTYVFEASKANWSEAIILCRRRNMEVISIQSEQENEEFVQRLANTGWENVWTSGKDVYENGHFQWVPLRQEFTYENWLEGQASRGFDEETWEEAFCVEILLKNNRGKWHDDLCSAKKNFVCEKYEQPLPAVTERNPIEKTTVRNGKKVFVAHRSGLTAGEAQMSCAHYTTSLANIKTQEEFEELTRVMSDERLMFNQGAWISGQDESGIWCMQVAYNPVDRRMTQKYEHCSNEAHVVCEYFR